jgi:flavorubredoxin
MKVQTIEILPNIYRISLKPEHSPISYNHFLVIDEKPTLVHLGHQANFNYLKQAISQIINPAGIRYLVLSHFEPDESGNLFSWLKACPEAKVLLNKTAQNSVDSLAKKHIESFKHKQSFNLGNDELICLSTPHFPHAWEAMLFILKKSKVLFSSDLGTQISLAPAAYKSSLNRDDIEVETHENIILKSENIDKYLKDKNLTCENKTTNIHNLREEKFTEHKNTSKIKNNLEPDLNLVSSNLWLDYGHLDYIIELQDKYQYIPYGKFVHDGLKTLKYYDESIDYMLPMHGMGLKRDVYCEFLKKLAKQNLEVMLELTNNLKLQNN